MPVAIHGVKGVGSMSEIVIQIPGVFLANAKVVAALADLTFALGGHSSAPAPAAVQADARIAANSDVGTDPRETQFFAQIDQLGELYGRYYRSVKAAGSKGLSVAEARKVLPELDSKRPKVLAAITGYSGRWCRHFLGINSPVEKTADGQRWIGWPEA